MLVELLVLLVDVDCEVLLLVELVEVETLELVLEVEVLRDVEVL